MWGDGIFLEDDALGGTDSFVFAGHNGQDTIFDFNQGQDHIDLRALDFTQIEELSISSDGINSKVDFGDGNSITVVNVAALTSHDFLFG